MMRSILIDDMPTWLIEAEQIISRDLSSTLVPISTLVLKTWATITSKYIKYIEIKNTERKGDITIGKCLHHICNSPTICPPDNTITCLYCSRQGVEGYNKDTVLFKMIEYAHLVDANIIVKAGKNAKWYLKNCLIEELDEKIEHAKCKNGSRITAVNRAKLYIV
jgi:hypothetical protein